MWLYQALIAAGIALGHTAALVGARPDVTSRASDTSSARAAIIAVPPPAKGTAHDLPGIERMFAGHRYIGLGEATHGTHEIFALKARIVQALVLRGGVKAIAFESNYGSTLAASDYVGLVGTVDLKGAVASLHIATYQTREIADLLASLREINSRRAPSRRVQLFGYDVQDPRGDVRTALEFLRSAGFATLADGAVARFAEGKGRVQTIPPADVPAVKASIEGFRANYLRNRAAIIDRSSGRLYERYLHGLDVALQSLSLFDASSEMAAYYMRDTLGAANVEWVEKTVGGPVIIWAHNTHIGKDNEVPEFVTLGEVLARAHGSDYFAMGSAFFDGSVRAVFGDKLVSNEVGTPREGSFEWFLAAQNNSADYIVDIAKAASRSSEWRTRSDSFTTLRAIGSAYEPQVEARTYRPVRPITMFDALAFIRHGSASIPYDMSVAPQ